MSRTYLHGDDIAGKVSRYFTCKRRGEQIPTDFVEVQLNDSIGKHHVTGSSFIEYRIKEEENDEEQPLAKRSAFVVIYLQGDDIAGKVSRDFTCKKQMKPTH